MKQHKSLYFGGMHCQACEILARHICDEIDGVECDSVSHKSGLLEITIHNTTVEKKLIKEMKKNGYIYSHKPVPLLWGWKILSYNDVIQIVGVIVIVWTVRLFAQELGGIDSLMSILGGTGYITAILTGLIASVSTCLAVTGGIVIGFSNYIDNVRTVRKHVGVQLLFQLGRVGGFFLFGSLLGGLGGLISISLNVTIVLSVVVAVLMLYLGGQILGLLPPLSHWGITIPSSLSNKIRTYKHPWIAPIIGALTFFIPCGFTQGMQLIVLGSGDWLIGGITMALFALGTAPVLFAVGLGSSWVKDRSRGLAQQIIGVIIIMFGLSTLVTTRNLIGRGSSRSYVTSENTTIQDGDMGMREIGVIHDGWQIVNRDISLPANTPYKITIHPQANGIGCMSHMVIPKAGFRNPEPIIKDDLIVFEGMGLQKGRYPIVCASMGMEMGALIVQ